MKKLHQLRQEFAAACDELENLVHDAKAFDKKVKEVEELKAQIERASRAQDIARGLAQPADGAEAGTAAVTKDAKGRVLTNSRWKGGLGEQLLAIARHYSGGRTDERLVRAPFGAGETDPSGGGFLVDVDFANTILSRAYDMGEISKRLFKLPISSGANGIKIPGIDEQSRATGSRWGGVQSFWVAEGDSVTATKPKFRIIELDLKKLMCVWYITDEMMADATALSSIANQAFAEEIMFMIEDSAIHGSGAGMPLGILNAPCKVKVAGDKGQAAATLTYQNILNMWSRMWSRSRKDACWFINQDVEPQLYSLSQVIGTGGAPVFLPAGPVGSQASGSPHATLLGRPVIPVEYCETLGTEGDIILADFSQYVMADKNEMQQQSSIHVRFLTDEMTFRITYRCDGEPIWHTPLTPYKGANTRTPFVTLANR